MFGKGLNIYNQMCGKFGLHRNRTSFLLLEKFQMRITLDTDRKTITVPQNIRIAVENLSNRDENKI